MASSPRKVLGDYQDNSNLTEDKDEVSKERYAPPQAPRSAFMCFTDARKKELVGQDHDISENSDLLKRVAEDWRNLSDQERAFWDEEARNDKVRFVREKAEYKGAWNLPKRRAKKHPLAPRRPMSAFLKFSQKRRAVVKEQNPDMSNTDVSRLLGEMWRNASLAERTPYVEEEERERAQYKREIQQWRENQTKMDIAARRVHHAVATNPHDMQQPYQPSRVPHRNLKNHYYESSSFENIQPLTLSDSLGTADRRIFRSFSGPSFDNQGGETHVFRPFGAGPHDYHKEHQRPSHGRSLPMHHALYPYRQPYHHETSVDGQSAYQETDHYQPNRRTGKPEEQPRFSRNSVFHEDPSSLNFYQYP